jgi:hypothetical protein
MSGFRYLMIWHPRVNTDAAHAWLRATISHIGKSLSRRRPNNSWAALYFLDRRQHSAGEKPVHTIKVLALGFVLLGAFLLIGRTLGIGAKTALYFLPVWLFAAAINLWYGVAKAGYSVRDEAPIFLVIFIIPAAMALLAWWKLPLR